MFNLRTAAVRAAAASARAQSMRAAGPQRISVIATASWVSRKTTIHRSAGFSTRSAALESERPIEPLDETVQPGTAPNPKLESEELLRRAQEKTGEKAIQGQTRGAAPATQSVPATDAYTITMERNRSLFVGNAPFNVTEDDIRADFGAFGEIESVYTRSLASDGWFTIMYSRPESMQTALEEAHDSFWHNRRITVKPRVSRNPLAALEDGGTVPRAPPRASDKETPYLYIGNLPRDMTDAELTGLFSDLGNVKAIRVATKPGTKELAGYAHVDFRTTEAAVTAKGVLENLVVKERLLRISYNKRFRRSPRTQHRNKWDKLTKGTDDSPAE